VVTEVDEPQAEFLDAECQAALGAIRGAEAAKKRMTVLLLAIAEAAGQPLRGVFKDERACNQRVWYQKWQYVPAIQDALAVLTERALAWRDRETARIEAQALQERRRAIATASLNAVKGLELTALNREDRADYRTDASRVLLTLADEELAVRLEKGARGAALPVDVRDAPPLVQVVMPDNGRDAPRVVDDVKREA
jgi:hypothetical protein